MINPHEQKPDKGGSFMMTIHGVNQYKSRYDFIVPKGFSSFISVAMHGGCGDCKSFVLDDEDISITYINTKKLLTTPQTILTRKVFPGAHTLFHKHGKKFGLWVYGFRQADGYKYPAGMSFN